MPVFNVNPYSKVESVERFGKESAGILAEARQAESEIQKQQAAQKGAMVLHDVIDQRIKATNNPDIGFAPFLDPVVAQTAAMIEPVARDYVGLLKGIHDKNVAMLKPMVVPGGFIKYSAKRDDQGNLLRDASGNPEYEHQFHQTKPSAVAITTTDVNNSGRVDRKISAVEKDSGKTLWDKTVEDVYKSGAPVGGTTRAEANKLKTAEVAKNTIVKNFQEKFGKPYGLDLDESIRKGELQFPEAKPFVYSDTYKALTGEDAGKKQEILKDLKISDDLKTKITAGNLSEEDKKQVRDALLKENKSRTEKTAAAKEAKSEFEKVVNAINHYQELAKSLGQKHVDWIKQLESDDSPAVDDGSKDDQQDEGEPVIDYNDWLKQVQQQQ